MEERYFSCVVCGWNGTEAELVHEPNGGLRCPNCDSYEVVED